MSIFDNIFKTFTTQNQHLINSFLGQTPRIKCTVPNDFLVKKEQLLFQEGIQPIAASIKEGLPVLMSTIVVGR